MNKKLFLSLLVIAQLSVPSFMIVSRENVLKNGALYKFKTSPVDPYDIFRGRYVALRVEANEAPVAKKSDFRTKDEIYVVLGKDEQGFAKLVKAQRTRPIIGDYIKARVSYNQNKVETVVLDMPWDRYYMNEKKAPKAGDLYRKHSRGKTHNAYILVRVLKGRSAIEGLYVNNMPIEEALKKGKE